MQFTDAIVSLSKRMAMEVGLGEDAFLQSVLLVGGSSQFRWMSERIERELRSRCKVGTEVNVFNSQDACLDAWKGAAAYANDLLEHNESFAAFVDKSTYNEVGMERTFLYN
jgi:actin-related protein 5